MGWYRLITRCKCDAKTLFYLLIVIFLLYFIIQNDMLSHQTNQLGKKQTHSLDSYSLKNTGGTKPILVKVKTSYIIGILTSKRYLTSRALDVYNTWGKQNRNISFFLGEINETLKTVLPITILKGTVIV